MRLRVLHVDTDISFAAHRESSTEFACDQNAFWKLTTTRVDYRQRNQRDVIGESDPAQPGPSPGKREHNEAQGNQQVEEFGEDKAHSRKSEIRSQKSYVKEVISAQRFELNCPCTTCQGQSAYPTSEFRLLISDFLSSDL